MQRIVILGAGGHAQVVADILMRARAVGNAVDPVGYLDDNPMSQGRTLLGLPVLGPIDGLSAVAHDAVIIAIGSNFIRRKLFDQLSAQGEELAKAIHPAAVIASHSDIGPGTMICAGAIVNPGSIIGANVILNTGCTVDHHNRIDHHVHIGPGSHLGGDVEIGEGTLVGIGATIMPQRRIGSWSVVGAGALVHSNLPSKTVAVGVPARIIKRLQ